MSLLDYNSSESSAPGSKKPLKLILGISALVGVIALGSTLAASINLNSGSPVEFGQGVAQTTACDSEILITPTSSYDNGTDEGSFMFSGVTLGNLDTTSEGCAGKTLTLDAYGNSGSSLASFVISIGADGSFTSGNGDLSNEGSQGTTSGVTLTFTPATLDATSVYRITIQSSGVGVTVASMRLATGYGHTCFTMVDTTVRCWGYGEYGQLGNGDNYDSLVPVVVTGLSGVTQLSSGREFSCALLSSGSVKCWGSQGADGAYGSSSVPVSVSGVSNATAVITGGYHACAIISGGTVKCWGNNGSGQLGDGTTDGRWDAQTVDGISTATQIAAAEDSSCALISGGSVKCWGANYEGQLGNHDQQVDALTPISVKYLNGENVVNAIQLTGDKTWAHYCVRYASGIAECWGANFDGQLGNGDSGDSSAIPVQVSEISDFSYIATGYYNTCGQRTNGSVYCWGGNEYGEIGDGTQNISKSAPGDPLNLSGVTKIDPGDLHICALISGDIVYCWGDNYYGQLGDGTTDAQNRPVLVNWQLKE